MGQEYQATFKVVNGQIYKWTPTPVFGLGEAGKWDWIAPVATGIGGAVASWIAGKSAGQQQQIAAQQGVHVGATSQGLFGGIDTTTLLLIGGAVLLFMSNPPSRR